MAQAGTAPLRVVLGDVHAIVREGLPLLLREHGVAVVAATASAAAAGAATARLRPDVVLLCSNLPDATELEPLGGVLVAGTPLALYVESEQELDLGDRHRAQAVVTKGCGVGELARVLRRVAARRPRTLGRDLGDASAEALRSRGLTDAELRVLARLAAGDSTLAAAGALGLSPHTVRTHLRNAMRKLGVSSRAHAVAIAVREAAIPS